MPLESPRGAIHYATTDHDYVASKEDLDANHNPYPSTDPKHAEFQRTTRAAAVERLGINASKLMRLSDFKAEEFHHDVAAAHRHEAAARRDREALAGGDVTPARRRYAPSSTTGFREAESPRITLLPTPFAAKGGAAAIHQRETNSAKLTINNDVERGDSPASPDDDYSNTIFVETTTTPAAAGTITCSAALHGGHSLLYATSDGFLHLAHVTPGGAPPTNAARSEATGLQFVDDSVRDRITTSQARAAGVMGREEQCDTGVWVSKRFHRSVRAEDDNTLLSSTSNSDDDGGSGEKAPFALCLSVAPHDAYVAIGLSNGSVQIWNYLTMEGVASLPPPPPPHGENEASREHVVKIHFLPLADTNVGAPESSTQHVKPLAGAYTLLLLYSNGSMSLVQFSIGSGTSALPPPYHGAMLSTTVSPTVRDAPHAFPFEEAGPAPPSITLLVQRTRLIRGTVVPNSLCVSVNDNVAYVANKEGEWFVVDLADVQLAMRWHLVDFLSKCENKVAGTAPSTTGAGVHKVNGSASSLQQPRPFVLPSTTTSQRVTFRDDANEKNISNASSFTVVHITSIDAHETWVVLGLSSGETILLQRTKGRLSRGVYAIRQYIDLVGLSTNTPGNNKHINSINSIHDSRSVLSRICPNSHTIVSIVRGKELVLWSLSPELQFSVLQRSPLLAATATTTDSTAAPSFSSLTDVSVHVLTDAMEVWSCGADGINYAWVSQFPRAQHEVHATQREADAICESNGVALIDWHVVVSRMGAESQLGVFAATDALCKASEADVFRRYFWKWLQFRLEHQLQRKHDSIAVILARSEFHRIGRDSFRKWVTFRNDRLRQKRNINAAAAIQALIAQQRMHGALTLWQRYRVHRRRQRECVSRVQILLEATQRRQRAIAYSRLRAFSRLQRLRRRWMLFSSTLENETVKALQRAAFMRWWGLRQRNIEIAHRNRIADSLANDVAHKQHAQFTFTTWKAYLEQKKRRAVLSSWSNTLGLNSTALVCSQYFHSWVQQAYLKRGEASLAKLKAAETSANALESKIMSAAPKVQRLRRVANLKERLAGCKDRMDELCDVQDGIAVRVTMLRLAERQDTEQQNRRESVSRCGSPLFAGCAAPPPHTTVEPQDALDASRRSNRSNVVGRGAGLDDTFRSADGSHNNTNNKDEPQPTPPVPGGSAASRGGESSLAHVEQSAVDMFPQSISWLKKRVLNFNTDEALIVQVVEKARGSGAGSFTGSVSGTPAKKLFLVTLQHIEKRVRDAFGATSTTDGRSNSVMSRTSGDDRSGQTPTAAERLATGSPHSLDDFATSSEQPLVDMWMPEEATEVELRAAIIRLVEKSPAIARGLLRDILSLVISYDCMPTGERRSGIPERSRAAFVHHAEVLDIIHDSLQRCGVTLTSL